jgi:hypothetical protein
MTKAALPREDRDELAAFAKEEEHILRGAAVIMQWSSLII